MPMSASKFFSCILSDKWNYREVACMDITYLFSARKYACTTEPAMIYTNIHTLCLHSRYFACSPFRFRVTVK